MIPEYVTFSNIIIDDIVLWDGSTHMSVLGGSGTHALIGMRVWSQSLGFVASVGRDISQSVYTDSLDQLGGVDLRAIVIRDKYQTARAWQLFEQDGTRTEIMRTDINEFLDESPTYDEMPADYRDAKGFHLIWGRDLNELKGLVSDLRKSNPKTCLLWEPSPDHMKCEATEYRELLHQISIFSPDIDQAAALTDLEDVSEMASVFVDWGAKIVAIRMGERGSYLATSDGNAWLIPAVAKKIVDVTGAGNAYCGGMLVGVADGIEISEAALRASVSASFALEQFGVPKFGDNLVEEAMSRLTWARQQIVEC
jgi:sugar/nucleoside kinase (ribokinase family)